MKNSTLVAVPDVLLSRLRPAWHADALCREYPMLDWFPQSGSHPVAATAVCRRCLVNNECLAAACDNHEAGVWGGTTQNQRVRLRRNTPVTPRPRSSLQPALPMYAKPSVPVLPSSSAHAQPNSG